VGVEAEAASGTRGKGACISLVPMGVSILQIEARFMLRLPLRSTPCRQVLVWRERKVLAASPTSAQRRRQGSGSRRTSSAFAHWMRAVGGICPERLQRPALYELCAQLLCCTSRRQPLGSSCPTSSGELASNRVLALVNSS